MTKGQKTGTVAGSAVAAAAAALIAVSFNSAGDAELDMNYKVTQNSQYSSSLVLEAPDSFTADIVELYMNGEPLTKCLLPDGELTSLPIVYTDMQNLSLKFYKLNEYVGEGEFRDDKTLHVTVDADVIKDNSKEE